MWKVWKVPWVGLALASVVLAFFMTWPVTARSHVPPALYLTGDLLRGRTIVIDPGHGGFDPGALGTATQEATLNLAIALQLKSWFEAAGARVLMTWSNPSQIPRHRKYRVQDRVPWINATHASVLIDIHCNSGMAARGPQVFYWDGASSRLLADFVAEELRYYTHTRRSVVRINQYVLRFAKMPAVNVEVGFINNRREERLLMTPQYQRSLAWYIFVGTERWFLRGRWPVGLLKAPPPTELLSR